ncbi:MAG: Maf family protein [Chloroflexota bacterium]
MPIILASASPRRRELLGVLGVSFLVDVADVDESPHAHEAPEQLVQRLAEAKALTVSRRRAASAAGASDAPGVDRTGADAAARGPIPDVSPSGDDLHPGHDELVLAADTTVVLDGAILNKPADEAEAVAMLRALRGRPHRVLTGLAFARADTVVWRALAETAVYMRAFTDEEIAAYVASGRPMDKAGAYGIQDREFRPVERIGGCYTNVVGLPLCEVSLALATVGRSRRHDDPSDSARSASVLCAALCRTSRR